MPKNNKSWGGCNNIRGNEDKSYYCHDDDVERSRGRDSGSRGSHIKHRVSFKSLRPRDMPYNLALANLDEDYPMNNGSNNNMRQVVMIQKDRGNQVWRKVSSGRNSPMPNRHLNDNQFGLRARLFPKEFSWYRVSILYGYKYEKDHVINALQNYIQPEVLFPITYKVTGNEATFYIDDRKMANALLNCDNKIMMNDGSKLKLKVQPGFPICEIDDKLKERLKQVVVKRYVQRTNALDLSKFYLDSDLVSDYFCALFYHNMFMTVLNIAGEYIPNLEALNLEGNKLQIIEKMIARKFSKLKILHIGDNMIRDINKLEYIKDLKLEELNLTGNPFCNKYRSRQNDYVRDVRERFPKLLRLDGVELPLPIVFDVVDEAANVRPSQRMFVPDAKAQEIAIQFLQQYFTIFDSENRQPLLNAYNEHAYFSMTISSLYAYNKLNGYTENRNLFRVNDSIRRQKLLKQGRLPVVSFISELPRTRHLSNTFTMDIALATQAMMFITITGYYQEIDNKDNPLRYFNRTFIIVPEGEGYCIRNEQLHISLPSEAQLKQLHQHLNELSNQQIQPGPSGSTEAEKPMAPELNNEIRQQMIMTLSQQTNMNLEWSLKCLQETHWIYENALSTFQEFFKRGQVPLAAFTK